MVNGGKSIGTQRLLELHCSSTRHIFEQRGQEFDYSFTMQTKLLYESPTTGSTLIRCKVVRRTDLTIDRNSRFTNPIIMSDANQKTPEESLFGPTKEVDQMTMEDAMGILKNLRKSINRICDEIEMLARTAPHNGSLPAIIAQAAVADDRVLFFMRLRADVWSDYDRLSGLFTAAIRLRNDLISGMF